MHKQLFLAVLVLLSLTRPSLSQALVLDPGGFSVDFRGAGQTAATGPELLTNPSMESRDQEGGPEHWQTDSYVWMPVDDAAAQTRMLARLQPLMRWESATTQPHGGQRGMHLAMPMSAYLPSDPAGHEFCAMFHQPVALPQSEQPSAYVLSYYYRGWSARDVPNSRPYVRVSFYDNSDLSKAATTRVYVQNIFAAGEQWRRGELQFIAPQNTRCLDVRLALTGPGEVFYDDVSLRRALVQDKGPTARLMPGGFLDNLFCLSSGDAGTMCFGFRNETGAKLEQPQLVLRLPEGVEVLDTAPAVAIERREARAGETPALPVTAGEAGWKPGDADVADAVPVTAGEAGWKPGDADVADAVPVTAGEAPAAAVEYRLDLTALKTRIHDGTFAYPYNQWEGLQLILRTTRPAGPARLKCSYWLQDGGYKSEPLSFDLQIVPPLPVVKGPRSFRSGAHLFLIVSLNKPEAITAVGKLYKQVGFNCVHVPATPLGAELGRLGIERYTQPFANGYSIGAAGPNQKPEEAVFRLVDGQPAWEAICPTEVYRQGAYFREQIVGDMLRRILVQDRTAEQLMCNWEPFMYTGKGCFCPRCKGEFAAYSKLPAAEVERVWPQAVIKEHGELWTKFRSWQHAQMTGTIEQAVHALGREAGLDSHFIPEIHYGLLLHSWANEQTNRETAAVDYLDRVPQLNAWAPYNWFIFGRGPYEYIRGTHLNIHISATEVQEFLRERRPRPLGTGPSNTVGGASSPEGAGRVGAGSPSHEGSINQLFAFPYGTYEGASEPEAIGFEMMTYLLEGYRGAIVYLWPGGYDARYWRAMADTNRQAASIEDFVREGKRSSQHTIKAETPLPRPDPRFLQGWGPVDKPERWKNLPLLLSWEYTRGDSRLLVVGNFWERGQCFFRLSLQGLRPGQQYVVRDPLSGRVFAASTKSPAVSAADLQRGLLLHVGAMRHACLIVEPYRKQTAYDERVDQKQMAAARQRLLPVIMQAAAE